MKITRDKITIAEKGAICALLLGVVQDWKEAYLIARGDDMGELPKTWETSASQWKQSAKIKKLYAELETIYKGRFLEQYNKGKEDGIQAGRESLAVELGTDAAPTDYTNPENQKRLLNRIIAKNPTSTDALDALKVIIAGQKSDKDRANDKQIQRFYTPLRCSQCPIKAAFAKIQGEKPNL